MTKGPREDRLTLDDARTDIVRHLQAGQRDEPLERAVERPVRAADDAAKRARPRGGGEADGAGLERAALD